MKQHAVYTYNAKYVDVVRTLDWLCIAADFVCCFPTWWNTVMVIKSMYEPPPRWRRICGKPPVYQRSPAIVSLVLHFNFSTFRVRHTQAVTQCAPVHLLYCLCHCLWCEWSICSEGEKVVELTQYTILKLYCTLIEQFSIKVGSFKVFCTI